MDNLGILIVDDEENMRRILTQLLNQPGYQVYTAANGTDALTIYRKHQISVVVTDLMMPAMSGMQLLTELLELDPSLPVIFMTAYGTVETAVEAMKKGAYDYILKPFDNEELQSTVKKAVAVYRSKTKDLYRKPPGRLLIGSSEKMGNIYETIDKVAASITTVLVCGETGTGKELVAREIHNRGNRSAGPFVCINCAALPDTLLESELFGYEKGAFTGAVNAKAGRFELAQGGTIFLDEISDMSLLMQTKLLRVLQDKTIARLGGTQSITVDTRIITATNKDLETECRKGTFRWDLYYRINVINIKIQPLRDHKEDIAELANYFIDFFCTRNNYSGKKLSAPALELLLTYEWPGNVRELENIIERAVVLSSGNTILPDDLGFGTINRAGEDEKNLKGLVHSTAASIEREAIIKTLTETKGNRTQAAKILGISRRNLLNKIKQFKLQ